MIVKVTVEEVVVQTFEVEAASKEEAIDLVRKDYRAGVIILDNAECQNVLVSGDGCNFEQL